MIAAETMVGANGLRVEAVDHDRLRQLLVAYGRLDPPDPGRAPGRGH